ncbi:trypsin-like serine peptidase [Methylomonas sp. MgM2]
MDHNSAAFDYAVIGPHDNRVHTFDTRRYPFNTVCHLLRDFGDGRWLGASGVLIAPNTVLTAAHCLYKHLLRRGPRAMYAVPGRSDRDTEPFGRLKASRFYVPQDYIESKGLLRRRYDYGVVMFDRAGIRFKQFMPTRAVSTAQWRRLFSKNLLTICGYPGDKPVGSQWHHQEFLKKVTATRLFYSVDTCPGHSGSPIWTVLNGEPVLVGIHTTGVTDEQGRPYGCRKGTILAPPDSLNSGVRFSPRVLGHIKDAVKDRGTYMKRFYLS